MSFTARYEMRRERYELCRVIDHMSTTNVHIDIGFIFARFPFKGISIRYFGQSTQVALILFFMCAYEVEMSPIPRASQQADSQLPHDDRPDVESCTHLREVLFHFWAASRGQTLLTLPLLPTIDLRGLCTTLLLDGPGCVTWPTY